MGYSKGRDKHLLTIGAHEVLYDKYQLVIQHPKGCANRGATCDRRKTFHPLEQAVEMLVTCREVLNESQQQVVADRGRIVAAESRG